MITVDMKALLAKLNPFCRGALETAAGACVSRSHYEVTVEHVLIQLLDEPLSDISLIFKHYAINKESFKNKLIHTVDSFASGNTAKPAFSPRLIEWYQEAQLIGTVELEEAAIRSGSLLLSLLSRKGQFCTDAVSDSLSVIPKENLINILFTLTKNGIETEKGSAKTTTAQKAKTGKSALAKYCEDFTAKAREGKIDPVFGRDAEIRQVIDIFARRRKNNPIVVGEAGVGKTAIVEGLALRVVEGDVPDFLKNITLMSLDMGLLQAGAGVKGEFENRLKNVIEEVKASEKPIILFIDEAHTMIGAGGQQGGSDAANLLKPALARGELRTVAATTWSEYKKYFEKDAALARRFQLVHLDEPSENDATLILRGLKKNYENTHGVIIRDDAVTAAAEMSSRYISGRYLPDKAIDLLDTSAARVKVLLTAKPQSVEAIERQLQALNRELEALKRDDIYGSRMDTEKQDQLTSQIDELTDRCYALTAKWKTEQQLAATLIRLRDAYYKVIHSAEDAVETDTIDSMTDGNGEEEPKDTESSKATSAEASTKPAEDKADSEEAPNSDTEETESDEPDYGILPADELESLIDNTLDELEQVRDGEPLVRTEVDPEIVSEVVSDWTGIPVGKVMHDEAEKVIELEMDLNKRVKGQAGATAEIAKIIRASKAGLNDPDQPIGVFLLTGPSGVGKTETGLALADLLFGGERFTVSVNMSEFQEKHTVSRLIGSPPGYVGYGEGGVLTEAVRQRPYSVVLLDEAEKANPEVMNLFYQVFDKGMLADGEGRNINFKNSVIFLTSNLGSEIVTQMISDNPDVTAEDIMAEVRPLLSQHFKPALLARMTVIPYVPLNSEIMTDIVELKLKKVVDRLMTNHKITLTCSQEVKNQIAARCLEVETGARNIDHIMNSSILPLLSQTILSLMGEEETPDEIVLGVDTDGNFIIHTDPSAIPEEIPAGETETKPDADPEAAPETKTDSNPGTKPETEPETKNDTTNDTDSV